MARLGRVGVVLFACAAVVSCESESKKSAAPVAVGEFARKYAEAWCAGLGPCCAQGGYPFDRAQCQQSVGSLLDTSVKIQTARPNVVFDEAVAGACVDAQRTRLASCDDRDTFNAGKDACDGLMRGTVALGGACGENYECAKVAGSAVLCDAGSCVIHEDPYDYPDPTRVGEGDACNSTCSEDPYPGYCEFLEEGAATTLSCFEEDGVVCSWTTRVCVPLPKVGEPCADGKCGRDTYCLLNECVAARTSGACGSRNECAYVSYCDIDTQSCLPKKANGQPCNDLFECSSAFCESGVCRDWSFATASSCAGALE